MSFFQYIQDVPDAPNNPSDDQPDMKINTNSTYGILAVDHVGFNENSATRKGGYHTVIHQGPQTVDPATIANFGQTYTKSVGSPLDQQLFYKSGLGNITQLTGALQPSAATNGYTALSGGLILQWGVVTSANFFDGDSGTVTFATSNISFPNNCFTVMVSAGSGAATVPSVTSFSVKQTTLSNLKFDWKFRCDHPAFGGVTNITTMFWMAIGN